MRVLLALTRVLVCFVPSVPADHDTLAWPDLPRIKVRTEAPSTRAC